MSATAKSEINIWEQERVRDTRAFMTKWMKAMLEAEKKIVSMWEQYLPKPWTTSSYFCFKKNAFFSLYFLYRLIIIIELSFSEKQKKYRFWFIYIYKKMPWI